MADRGFLERLYRRIVHKFYSVDLEIELQLHARKEAVAYILKHMEGAAMAPDRHALLKYAVRHTKVQGSILEFGVAGGDSINVLGKALPDRAVHGFDSFEGLPEDWAGTVKEKGRYSQGGKLPPVPSNVQLHKGWFDQTIPVFLAQNKEPVSFLHIDCDIYSSTKTVLELLGSRIQPGTTIVFDEYYNYHGWKLHEYKAFQEWIAATGRRYKYLAFSTKREHVAVQMES